jgi:hypothetical protein
VDPRNPAGMEDLEHLAAVVIALVSVVVFAMMIWAGQHQS